MKNLFLAAVATFAMSGVTFTAHAESTAKENATATARDVKRAGKKVAHRAKEMVCMKGDAKCLAEKAKHRAQEGAEAVSDKAKGAADAIDNNDTAN